MRNLTIKREKRFVASLGSMKVYIEDDTSSDIVIDNVSYRKIGVLENGEEKTFIIGENECSIVVIADKLSKNYCNELYRIPAGEDDVFLSGKNVFNPATGNAFRFNESTDSNVLQNRKKGLKKGIIVISIFAVIGAVSGILITNFIHQRALSKPEVFSKDEMTITLTKQFHESAQDGFTICYDSQNVAVFALKEEFSLFEGFDQYTLSDYGNLIITNSLDSSVKLQSNDGLTYFEYRGSNPETKDLYHYFAAIFKTSDSFWMIQFAALDKDYNHYQQDIIDWANSIKFSNSKIVS